MSKKIKQINWKSIYATCSTGRVFAQCPQGKGAFMMINNIPSVVLKCINNCPSDVMLDIEGKSVKLQRNSQVMVQLSKCYYEDDILVSFDGKILIAVTIAVNKGKSEDTVITRTESYTKSMTM